MANLDTTDKAKTKSKMVSIVVSEETYTKLQHIASVTDRSISSVVRLSLEYLCEVGFDEALKLSSSKVVDFEG